MEDRRITPNGIGKYRLKSGLAMNFKGTRYVVLAFFEAPNDHKQDGNPIEMTLIWSPRVPEDCSQQHDIMFFSGSFGVLGRCVGLTRGPMRSAWGGGGVVPGHCHPPHPLLVGGSLAVLVRHDYLHM